MHVCEGGEAAWGSSASGRSPCTSFGKRQQLGEAAGTLRPWCPQPPTPGSYPIRVLIRPSLPHPQTPPLPGTHEVHCRVAHHWAAGQRAAIEVLPPLEEGQHGGAGTSQHPAPYRSGATRVHYIQAETVEWDYAPQGYVGCVGGLAWGVWGGARKECVGGRGALKGGARVWG